MLLLATARPPEPVHTHMTMLWASEHVLGVLLSNTAGHSQLGRLNTTTRLSSPAPHKHTRGCCGFQPSHQHTMAPNSTAEHVLCCAACTRAPTECYSLCCTGFLMQRQQQLPTSLTVHALVTNPALLSQKHTAVVPAGSEAESLVVVHPAGIEQKQTTADERVHQSGARVCHAGACHLVHMRTTCNCHLSHPLPAAAAHTPPPTAVSALTCTHRHRGCRRRTAPEGRCWQPGWWKHNTQRKKSQPQLTEEACLLLLAE
jgi:uncharacterized low-complexity protein